MTTRPTRRRRDEPLKITNASVRPPMAAEAARAAGLLAGHRHLAVQVENPNPFPMHVWASRRHYDYDSATHVLSIWMTDNVPEPPPGIQMVSDHPRTPEQVEVAPNGSATIQVTIPDVIRKRRPGTGLGMSFTEQPIGRIDHVELHVQYGEEPAPNLGVGDPARHRQALREHGDVVHATLAPDSVR
jgi:hypothetical protein